jgi:hypothetical protein
MYNHLHNGGVQVEGDSSRDGIEMLPNLCIELGSEEVFHQGNGHVPSVATSRETRNLDGVDGDRAESLVQAVSKFHG